MKENNKIELLERFLKEGISNEDEASLLKWFGSDNAKEEISSFLEEKWHTAELQLPEDVRNRMLNQIREKANIFHFEDRKKVSLSRLSRYMATACICFLLGIATWALWSAYSTNKDFVVFAENGMQTTLELPDGTNVWLNSGSSLRYNNAYNVWNRTVVLEGEAYFEVEKHQYKNFTVESKSLKIEALGTKFNVTSYKDDDRIITTLLEGKIGVKNKTEEYILSEGQQIEFNNLTKTFLDVKNCDANTSVLWKNNILFFDSQSLDEISKILERRYSINFIFVSEAVKKYTFSGTIKNTDLTNVLECIQITAPVKYKLHNDTLYFDNK